MKDLSPKLDPLVRKEHKISSEEKPEQPALNPEEDEAEETKAEYVRRA